MTSIYCMSVLYKCIMARILTNPERLNRLETTVDNHQDYIDDDAHNINVIRVHLDRCIHSINQIFSDVYMRLQALETVQHLDPHFARHNPISLEPTPALNPPEVHHLDF